eukprot:357008-Chlamydomonas_euryale.AAC.1
MQQDGQGVAICITVALMNGLSSKFFFIVQLKRCATCGPVSAARPSIMLPSGLSASRVSRALAPGSQYEAVTDSSIVRRACSPTPAEPATLVNGTAQGRGDDNAAAALPSAFSSMVAPSQPKKPLARRAGPAGAARRGSGRVRLWGRDRPSSGQRPCYGAVSFCCTACRGCP